MFRKSFLILSVVLVLSCLFMTSWAGDDKTPKSIAAPSGVTPGMAAEWWQWAIGLPTSVHPLRTFADTTPPDIDPSSDFCMVGQHGNYWFGGGSFKQVDIIPNGVSPAATATNEVSDSPDFIRKCSVPLGTTILVPVLNGQCNTAEEIYLENLTGEETFEERKNYLQECARTQADEITTAEASLTGPLENIQPLKVHRVQSSPQGFPVTYAPDHILQFGTPWEPTVNPSLTFDDGYWVAFKPLHPGTFELNTFGDVPAYEFSLRIKYILEIIGPQDQ
jgi:hypothetical protein